MNVHLSFQGSSQATERIVRTLWLARGLGCSRLGNVAEDCHSMVEGPQSTDSKRRARSSPEIVGTVLVE